MILLILGLIIFLGVHALTMMRDRRSRLIAALGAGRYKGLYSLVSFIGLALIVWGYIRYRAGGYIPVWEPPPWAGYVTLALMLPFFPLLNASYRPGRIKEAVKHPLLAAVMLWAVAHLIANGDLGSILLFGAVLIWAALSRISQEGRADSSALSAARAPDAATARRNDIMSVVVGLALYYIIVFSGGHQFFFGVPALR